MKKFGLTVIFVVIMLLTFSSISYGESVLIRDEWFLLEEEGQPVGYSQEQLWETSEGYSFQSHVQLQMNFVGQIITYTEYFELNTDPDFYLTSVLRVTDTNGSQTRVEGQFLYGNDQTTAEILHVDGIGEERTSYWQWEEGTRLFSAPSFLEKVRSTHGYQVGEEYSATVWDVVEQQPIDFMLKVNSEEYFTYKGEDIPVYNITYHHGDLVVHGLIDARNNSYWSSVPEAENLEMYRTERDEIPELQAFTVDALIVPSNILVSHPYRSTSSLIEVIWYDVDFDDFNLEDNRQELIHHDVTEELKNRVLLNIKRDEKDYTGQITLPVSEDNLELYLLSDEFINPELPEVEALVTQILGEEQDGFKAVEKLVEATFDFISSEFTMDTLTTSEILQRQVGKCSEYAILFAALARNAGIPTRLALGHRYQGNIWVGHMWNEVWLGEWVAVDPSHNQVNPDALLIKLVHSDTVMGTQGVRQGLIGKLDILIEDVQIQERGDGTAQTGIHELTYYNQEFGCSVTAPEGWEMLETEDQGMPVVIIDDPGGIYSAVLLLMPLPPGIQAEQLIASRVSVMPNHLPNFELQYEQSIVIANIPGAAAAWSFTQDELTYMQENRIIVAGDVGYLFVFTTPAEDFEQGQEYFHEILDSFRLL